MIEDVETVDFPGLLRSLVFAVALLTILPNSIAIYITEPVMRDQSVFIGSRYTFTVDALHTIENDGFASIIAIGSSMTFKSIDGGCIGGALGDGFRVYNLAQPASKPYTDMQHIPRIIKTDPILLMIELSPDILSTPVSESSKEYVQLRYSIDTMYQDRSDLGEWMDILPEEYSQFVATNDLQRAQFRQKYVPEAIEEHLHRLVHDESTGRAEGQFGWVPDKAHSEWTEYLQTPTFPPDRYGLEGMTEAELLEYHHTKMHMPPWASPPSNGTLSHDALTYQIQSLVDAGVEVLVLTPPYHPDHLVQLEVDQWDGFNDTVTHFARIEGVNVFDQTWTDIWTDEDFYDRNHLDDEGRKKYCEELKPRLAQLLNE